MFLDFRQTPIYVNQVGRGEPLLMLHGVPDSAELWNGLIEQVKHRYTCYAPDMPGFFRSGLPGDFRYELDDYAEFVDQLVEQLGLPTPLDLVIHDWGGIFGLLWACKYPHKVKRIIGGDFPFSHLYTWHEWATVWRTPVLGELSMLVMNWPVFKLELKRGSRRLSETDLRRVYEGKLTQWRTRFHILKLYRSADMDKFIPWQARLKRLSEQVPIDLIWGENDPYVASHQASLMHPRSVRIVPDCGHWVPSEAPEEYTAVILDEACGKNDTRHRHLTEANAASTSKRSNSKKAKYQVTE